jgi:hypothetical protein
MFVKPCRTVRMSSVVRWLAASVPVLVWCPWGGDLVIITEEKENIYESEEVKQRIVPS